MLKLLVRWFRMVGMCVGNRKKLVDEEQVVPYTDGDWSTAKDKASAIPKTSDAPRQIDSQHFLLLGDHRSPDYDRSGQFTKPTFTSEELRGRLETVQYERHRGLNFTAERFGGEPPDSWCDAVSTGYDYMRDLADLVWHDRGESTLCESFPLEYLEVQPGGQDSQVVVAMTELTDDSFNDKTKTEAKPFPFERRAVISSAAGASLLSVQGPCLIELAEYEPVDVEEPDPLTGTIRGGAGSLGLVDSSGDVVIASRVNAEAASFQPVSKSSSCFLDAETLSCMRTGTQKPIPLQANRLNQRSGGPTSIPVSVPGSPRPQQSAVIPGRMFWLYVGAKGEIRGPYSGLAMQHWYCGGRFRRLNNWLKGLEGNHFETIGDLVHRLGEDPFSVPHVAGVHNSAARPVSSRFVDATPEIAEHVAVEVSRRELNNAIQLLKIEQSIVRQGHERLSRDGRNRLHYGDKGPTYHLSHGGKRPEVFGMEPMRDSEVIASKLGFPILGHRSHKPGIWSSTRPDWTVLDLTVRKLTPQKELGQTNDHEKNRYVEPVCSSAVPEEMSRAVPGLALRNAIANNPTCGRDVRTRSLWDVTPRAIQKRLRYRPFRYLDPRTLEVHRISQLSRWKNGPRYPKNRIPRFHPKATHGRMFPEWTVSSFPSQPVDTSSLRGGYSSGAEEEYDPDDCESDTDGGVVHGSSSEESANQLVSEITLAMKSLEKKLSTVEAMIFVRLVLPSNDQIDLEDSFIANLFGKEEVDTATLLPRTAAGVQIPESDSEDGHDTELFTGSAADRLVNETPLAMKLPPSETDSEDEHDTELLPDANQARGRRLNPAADEFVPTAGPSIHTPPDYVDAITTTLPIGLRYFDLTRRARYTRDDTELPSYEECSHSMAPPYTRYHVEPLTLGPARSARTSMVNILGRYRRQRSSLMSINSPLREAKSHLGPLQDFQSAAELVDAYHASVPPIQDADVEDMWQLSRPQPVSLVTRQAKDTENRCGECETCRENQREEEVWYYWAWNGKSPAVSWAGEAIQAEDATWRSRNMQRRCERSRRLARESQISRRVSPVVRSRAVEEAEHVVVEITVDDSLSQTPVEAASEYPTQDIIMQEINGEVYYFDAREVEDVWRGRAVPAWTCSSREVDGQDLVGRLEELD